MRSDVFLYGELGPYQTLREPVGRFGSQRNGSILISDVHPAFAGGPDDRKEYPQG